MLNILYIYINTKFTLNSQSKEGLLTFIVDSTPGVCADQQSGSERLRHHTWILLTDDPDVSGQETDVSSQRVGERRT